MMYASKDDIVSPTALLVENIIKKICAYFVKCFKRIKIEIWMTYDIYV